MTAANMAYKTSSHPHSRVLIYGGFRDDIRSVGLQGSPSQLHHVSVPDSDITVVGSSGGLIAFSSSDALFVWNPSTSQVRKIPQSDSESVSFMGFCFCADLDDYVICKIVLRWGCWHAVEFFCLKTDSWREVGSYNLPVRIDESNGPSPPVTLHGCHHWVALRYGKTESLSYSIAVFDLVSEAFSEISFPQDICTKDKVIHMGIFKGRLCLICYDEVYCCDAEIWVMWSYGKVESWKKEFSVPICLGIVQPFTSTQCGWGEDDKLLLKNSYGDLVLYDTRREEVLEELFDGDEFENENDDEYDRLCYQVATYSESQVSVGAMVDGGRKRKSRGLKNDRIVRKKMNASVVTKL